MNATDIPLNGSDARQSVMSSDTGNNITRPSQRKPMQKWSGNNEIKSDDSKFHGELPSESQAQSGDWNQFKKNQELFNVRSTYREELYTTKLDMENMNPEIKNKAKKLAKEIEIESQTEGSRAIDQDGLPTGQTSEEAQFSSVNRKGAASNSSVSEPGDSAVPALQPWKGSMLSQLQDPAIKSSGAVVSGKGSENTSDMASADQGLGKSTTQSSTPKGAALPSVPKTSRDGRPKLPGIHEGSFASSRKKFEQLPLNKKFEEYYSTVPMFKSLMDHLPKQINSKPTRWTPASNPILFQTILTPEELTELSQMVLVSSSQAGASVWPQAFPVNANGMAAHQHAMMSHAAAQQGKSPTDNKQAVPTISQPTAQTNVQQSTKVIAQQTSQSAGQATPAATQVPAKQTERPNAPAPPQHQSTQKQTSSHSASDSNIAQSRPAPPKDSFDKGKGSKRGSRANSGNDFHQNHMNGKGGGKGKGFRNNMNHNQGQQPGPPHGPPMNMGMHGNQHGGMQQGQQPMQMMPGFMPGMMPMQMLQQTNQPQTPPKQAQPGMQGQGQAKGQGIPQMQQFSNQQQMPMQQQNQQGPTGAQQGNMQQGRNGNNQVAPSPVNLSLSNSLAQNDATPQAQQANGIQNQGQQMMPNLGQNCFLMMPNMPMVMNGEQIQGTPMQNQFGKGGQQPQQFMMQFPGQSPNGQQPMMFMMPDHQGQQGMMQQQGQFVMQMPNASPINQGNQADGSNQQPNGNGQQANNNQGNPNQMQPHNGPVMGMPGQHMMPQMMGNMNPMQGMMNEHGQLVNNPNGGHM